MASKRTFTVVAFALVILRDECANVRRPWLFLQAGEECRRQVGAELLQQRYSSNCQPSRRSNRSNGDDAPRLKQQFYTYVGYCLSLLVHCTIELPLGFTAKQSSVIPSVAVFFTSPS